MGTRFIKDDFVYYYDNDRHEFVKICHIDEYSLEKEKELMEDERDVELFNKLKTYEKHWYIPVPFTKKRLIFVGLKYQGWYTYK